MGEGGREGGSVRGREGVGEVWREGGKEGVGEWDRGGVCVRGREGGSYLSIHLFIYTNIHLFQTV